MKDFKSEYDANNQMISAIPTLRRETLRQTYVELCEQERKNELSDKLRYALTVANAIIWTYVFNLLPGTY